MILQRAPTTSPDPVAGPVESLADLLAEPDSGICLPIVEEVRYYRAGGWLLGERATNRYQKIVGEAERFLHACYTARSRVC